MGTLFNQRVRARHAIHILGSNHELLGNAEFKNDDITTLESTVNELMELSEATGVSIPDLIALWAVLETNRLNKITVEDHDAKDEQLMGFGKLLQELIEVISDFNPNK